MFLPGVAPSFQQRRISSFAKLAAIACAALIENASATGERLDIVVARYEGTAVAVGQFRESLNGLTSVIVSGIKDSDTKYLKKLSILSQPDATFASWSVLEKNWQNSENLEILRGRVTLSSTDSLVVSRIYLGEELRGRLPNPEIVLNIKFKAQDFSKSLDSHAVALLYALAMDERRVDPSQKKWIADLLKVAKDKLADLKKGRAANRGHSQSSERDRHGRTGYPEMSARMAARLSYFILVFSLIVPQIPRAKSVEAGEGCSYPNDNTVRLLVPAFDGVDALGLNVSTILQLQIFNTLEMARSSEATGRSFGHGMIIWSRVPLSDPSHAGAAEMAAKDDPACPEQLVLWGKASHYAEGIVVQTYLTLPTINDPRVPRHEVWTLRLNFKNDPIDLSLDVPSRRYAFEPIVLDADIVRRYSDPSSLKIYSDQSLKKQVGTTGSEFVAWRRGVGGTWLFKPTRGWLPLPQLSQNTSEVVGFTGAIIRVFRGDWFGAQKLLQQVLSSPTTPNAIQTDALIYMGMTAEKLQNAGINYFERALLLNSLSEKAIAGLVMSNFAKYARSSSVSSSGQRADEDNHATLRRIKELLDKNKFLFEPDDPWLRNANRAYDRLISGDGLSPLSPVTE